jgi:hypothetical protein
MPAPAQISGQIAQRLENLRQHGAHDKTTDCTHSLNLPANLWPYGICACIRSMNYITTGYRVRASRATGTARVDVTGPLPREVWGR